VLAWWPHSIFGCRIRIRTGARISLLHGLLLWVKSSEAELETIQESGGKGRGKTVQTEKGDNAMQALGVLSSKCSGRVLYRGPTSEADTGVCLAPSRSHLLCLENDPRLSVLAILHPSHPVVTNWM
jgi:hypothetical protein